jgi:uncharacterized membrane protein
MQWLVVGLVVFLGVHSVSIINRRWRNRMVARLGEWSWKGLYSLVAAIGLACVVYGYGLARQEPSILYVPPAWLRHVALLLMLPVFPFLLSTYLPGRIKSTIRHPTLNATKFWATAHLCANGGWHDVLLFGGFLLWASIDRVSVKYRADAPQAVAPQGGLVNDAIALFGGLALYALFVFWAHGKLIGVPLLTISN